MVSAQKSSREPGGMCSQFENQPPHERADTTTIAPIWIAQKREVRGDVRVSQVALTGYLARNRAAGCG